MKSGKTDDKVAAEANGPLSWGAGGVPVSRRFDDPYYSLESGRGYTHYLLKAGETYFPTGSMTGFTWQSLVSGRA